MQKSDSQKILVRPTSSISALHSLKDPLNGKGNLLDYKLPARLLDNLIDVEEQMYGFSLFHRGVDLRKSLIDPTKVRNFIEKKSN
jgi:hypothetical protein